ncbi:MAG: ketoacyl-ACP synthase III [Acidobacteriia bacterium]|nr:ketoacyl-ACP synthase III [Terriglobia bacterium]
MNAPAAAVAGVRIAGIASAVPSQREAVADAGRLFGAEEVERIQQSSGVQYRHIAPESICASDLCQAAAERLLEELGWPRESIGVLIFVSQTPDYVLPATSCALQARLGLAKDCAAFDVNLACSGYIYGLWMAALTVASGRRALLLVGDTTSRFVSTQDRTTALLFGDAGTATTLEPDSAAPPMHFELGTDGSGERNLIVPAGGFRLRHSEATAVRTEGGGGNLRSKEDLFMDGGEIFAFTLTCIPKLIRTILERTGWTADDVGHFVFHQSNRFILQHLSKRMKLPPEKVVLALENYGNTGSASIPLAITTHLRETVAAGSRRLILAGYGAGYSWGAAGVEVGPICVPEVVLV